MSKNKIEIYITCSLVKITMENKIISVFISKKLIKIDILFCLRLSVCVIHFYLFFFFLLKLFLTNFCYSKLLYQSKNKFVCFKWSLGNISILPQIFSHDLNTIDLFDVSQIC